MPPRARPQTSRPSASQSSTSRPSARSESLCEALSPEELASLAGFDLIESALDEFQPPPELATRRELKAAKSAARSASVKNARASAQPTQLGQPAH